MIKSSIFWHKEKRWKISIVLDFLKLPFSGLKSILFHPEYQKTIFSGLICPINRDDKKFNFFDKNHGPVENFQPRPQCFSLKKWVGDYLDFLKLLFSGLKSILFYPEYQKTIFSGLICPKNTDDKKFLFLTKTMDLWKISVFWSFLKLPFSGLKSNLFYPEHKKRSFLT